MTDAAKFAEDHGLSLEEATLILTRRSAPKTVLGRLAKALGVLQNAEAKVGVASVTLEGAELVKGDVPMENLERFYKNPINRELARGMQNVYGRKPVAVEDESQDPEDYP